LDQATRETRNSSIEAIVNQRTIEAFRERRDGGAQPNHGEIAVRAQTDYDADPVLMRRGSVVLPKLQALLQQELGSNPRIFFPSHFLRSDVLRKIAAEVWATPTPAVDEQIPLRTSEL
jgi:hypothetical protein